VLEKQLKNSRHGASLSEREGAQDEVRWDRRLRNRDYAARPLAPGQIHTVLLLGLPKTEGEGFQGGGWEVLREVDKLGLGMQFSEVEVFTLWTGPIGCECAWVCPGRLSIKLDGQGVDGYRHVGVEEAMHVKGSTEERGLWQVLLFSEGEKRTEEVAIRQEDDRVLARVRAKGQDASDGSICSHPNAVMARAKAPFDATSIGEGKERDNEVIGVGDWVDMD